MYGKKVSYAIQAKGIHGKQCSYKNIKLTALAHATEGLELTIIVIINLVIMLYKYSRPVRFMHFCFMQEERVTVNFRVAVYLFVPCFAAIVQFLRIYSIFSCSNQYCLLSVQAASVRYFSVFTLFFTRSFYYCYWRSLDRHRCLAFYTDIPCCEQK